MPHLEETYDIAVVGAGHAGCEAALACARLGLETRGLGWKRWFLPSAWTALP